MKEAIIFLSNPSKAFHTFEQHILYGIYLVVTCQLSGSYQTFD